MKKEIYLAGGCFWGLEKYFSAIDGVVSTEVGYANGKTANPTYQEVCYGYTDHAETVHIVYDSRKIQLGFLLEMFYRVIDPTALNHQGLDIGRQYRSGVYYTDPGDRDIILSSLEELQQDYSMPIVIEAKELENYYPAEDYHQRYLEKNPNGYCHIGKAAFQVAESVSCMPSMVAMSNMTI